MEKKWSLIFIGLCLALVFSVSSVEAQFHHGEKQCKDGLDNDEDGPIDCDDPDCFSKSFCSGEDPPMFVPVQICHFKNILKHCEDLPDNPGTFLGGGERTVTSQRQLDQHLGHGDCVNLPGGTLEFHSDSGCVGHCIAVTPAEGANDCSNINRD